MKARGGSCLSASPDGSSLFVMGGFNGNELDDMHRWVEEGVTACGCFSTLDILWDVGGVLLFTTQPPVSLTPVRDGSGDVLKPGKMSG